MIVGNFWKYLRESLRGFQRRNRNLRRRRDGRFASLYPELLEQRELLSLNQITFDVANSRVVISGTSDADQVTVVTQSASQILVRAQSIDGIVESTFQLSSVASVLFLGGDGNDRFENNTAIVSRALGEAGADYLVGGSGVDELQGGVGNDELLGGAGNDLLVGGEGNDKLRGHEGDDRLVAEGGHDILFGGDGKDELFGGFGDDELWGGEGNDQLRGNEGDDRLIAEGGADDLQGGDGDDEMFGGLGNDLLLGGEGSDQLRGNEGDDRLFGDGGNDDLMGMDGNDELFGGLGSDRILGGEGNDQLRGNDGNDRLLGEGGVDDLQGGDGIDELHGGAHNDLLSGGEGNDELRGNDGDDRLFGDGGNDDLQGHIGNDELFGGLGNDLLWAGEGNDQLRGEENDDRLIGEAGNDDLQGGDGNDEMFGGLGNDLLWGGDGNDQLRGDAGDDRLYGEGGIDDLRGYDGNDQLFGGLDNDLLMGGEGNDTLRGDAGDDRLMGDGGIDDLMGMEGNDELYGGLGNDLLLGGEGNDLLRGNEQDDRLNGEAGTDDLQGGDGIDELMGGAGDDLLFGGEGDDQLRGNEGADRLSGDGGVDDLIGGDGNDDLFGGTGNDILTGDLGNDRLYGEDGNDKLLGTEGSDIAFGGAGVDQLWSGVGNHVLVGGAGNDVLTGAAGRDILIGGEGLDQLDGKGGEDLLIGGTTVYDESTAQLGMLLSGWSVIAPYAVRVEEIESELFSARLESNATVFDDQIADTIFGSEGLDWFFLTGFLGVYDPNLAGHGGHDHGTGHEADGGGSHDHSHAAPIILDHPPALEGFALIDSLDKLNDRQTDEVLQSLIPHADESVLQREHLSLFQLVRYSQVTHHAVASGAWSDPNTWHAGVVPGNGARVLIPIGVEVTVNQVISARLATVRVDGTLSFATTANSELRVDTIVVSSVGRFEMGTEAAPVAANVTAKLIFTNSGPIDRVADPFGISRGLVSHGSVSMHGAAVTTQMTAIGSVTAGSNNVQLSTMPVGWKVGQSIVLAGTNVGVGQNEVRRIVAILGNIISVDFPFSYSHVPASAAFKVHVANLTRNVILDSESTAVDRRGHVMFMHNRDVHIANAGFYRLGRTDKFTPINDPVVNSSWVLAPGTGTNPRGRYSVHFHRNGFIDDGNPATISGSVAFDSPGWGIVNHSSYVDITDNVAYDVQGAAFATEVGDEIGSFRNNIAIGSTDSGESINARQDIQDFGHNGDGFWFQGTGVAVTGNIAAGNEGAAFRFYARGLIENGEQRLFLAANLPDPSIADGAESIDVAFVPILEFSGNIGYSSAIGLAIRYHLRDAPHDQLGTFADSAFWGNTMGVDLSYSHRTVLRNLSIVTVPNFSAKVGIGMNTVTRDITYENLTISGYNLGIAIPWHGYSIVRGGSFNNTEEDILIFTGHSPFRFVQLVDLLGTPRVSLEPSFGQVNGSINHIFQQDTIIADYGAFDNRRLYYAFQHPNAIPFPVASPGVPAAYVNRTSQYLYNQFGIAIGGQLAPAGTFAVPSIVGLVGPAA